ncbi:MAG TPA: Calx-beta domain-containing protein, partial [Polyangia bacterium]
KQIPGASLEVTLSQLFFEGIDGNNDIPPTESQCLQMRNVTFSVCRQEIDGSAWFTLEVTNVATGIKFLKASGAVDLAGHRAAWDYNTDVDADSTMPLWNLASFQLERDFDDDGGRHATVSLVEPIEIPIPLDQIGTGQQVKVHVEVSADAANFRQRESYVSAYFRDPVEQQGAVVTVDGLKAVNPPASAKPEQPAPSPAPCPTDADPAAGTIAFADAAPVTPETPLRRGAATILVTRTGGTQGEVSALLTTADGTAQAGADYVAVMTEVRFADGEAGPRTVRIPILNDTVQEPDETVALTLSRPLGCAALGAQAQAVLTIVDDDGPPTPTTMYDVSGTVTGLAGTGLVLRDVATGRMASATETSFSFGRQYVTGESYEVRVDSQPMNPRQSCTVANGMGTIADHDVTDVQITCVADTVVAGLDTSFGSGGKSTAGNAGAVVALAVQPDGKIIAIGPQTLARYTTAGALDTTFGTAGEAPIRFRGDTSDQAQGVAIQADGKIVVVGISGATNQDFAISRFTAAGQPDPDFGHGAAVATDFAGSTDRAAAVVIQADGRLVVAGQAADPSPSGTGTDFAVARYTAAGDLDASFGTGGKVMTNVAGSSDLGYAVALQPDGNIVVAGHAAATGGDSPDIGLARYLPSGAPDEVFGTHGVVHALLTGIDSDEANGVAVQPDGKIVVSSLGVVGAAFSFNAVRFDAAGGVDLGFGSSGVASASFGAQNQYPRGMALQADGKIVVVGQNPNSGMGDFGVVRF